MKRKMIALVLGMLLTMPCVLCAQEVEILLMEVIGAEIISGDEPLDGADKEDKTPPRPRDFRATIDGTMLVVTKQESAIPSAQAIVANASTGSIVVNQPFTTSITQQISTPGVYALRIHTAGGDLIGQFIVQ